MTRPPPGLVLLVWRLRYRSEWRAGRVLEHRSPARLGRGDGGQKWERDADQQTIEAPQKVINSSDQLAGRPARR